MNHYFYCYSYPLKCFFMDNGLKYIASTVNNNTGKKYWVFESSDRITELLQIWRSKKKL